MTDKDDIMTTKDYLTGKGRKNDIKDPEMYDLAGKLPKRNIWKKPKKKEGK